jgi:hypothetical protein
MMQLAEPTHPLLTVIEIVLIYAKFLYNLVGFGYEQVVLH